MTSTSPDNSSAPASQDAKPPRPWTWKRRLRTAAIVIVVGTLVFRALLSLLLPVAIARTARALGYTVAYDRLQLSLLGTNAALWGVDIKTRDGTQQILKCEYAYGNISSTRLLRLGLKAWRLEADDVTLDVVRNADGSIPILQALASSVQPSKPKAGAPKAISFAAPLEVHAVRLHNLALHVRDESVSPVFEHTFRTDLRVSTIGKPGSPATLDLECTTDALFDAIRATGQATTTATNVDAKIAFTLKGLRATAAAPYLQAFGISVADRSTDIRGSAAVALAAIPNAPGEVSGSVSLSEIFVTSESETSAALEKADIQIASLSPSSLHVKQVLIDKGSVHAERTASGALRFASFKLEGDATETRSNPAIVAPAQGTTPAATAPASTPNSVSAGKGFDFQLDKVAVSGIGFALSDRAVIPENTLKLSVDQVHIDNIATRGTADSTSKLTAAISAPGLFTTLTVDANANPFAPTPGGRFSCTLTGIHAEAVKPYLSPLGIQPDLDSGTFRVDGTATVTTKPGGSAQVSLAIANALLKDGASELFTLPAFTVSGISFGSSIEIASIEGKGPIFNVARTSDGLVTIPGFKIGLPPTAHPNLPRSPVSKLVQTLAPAVLPPIKINKLAWSGTRIRFDDQSTPGILPVEIADAGFEINSLVIDPRSSATPTPGTLKAWLKSPGVADVSFTGTLTPGAGGLSTRLVGKGTGLNLTQFSPYLKPLGIEATLQDGSFTLDVAAAFEQTRDSTTAALAINEASLLRGNDKLGTASGIRIPSVTIAGSGISVGKIEVGGASTGAKRSADGSIDCLGFRLLPTGPSAPAASKPTGALPDPFAVLASAGRVSLAGVNVQNVKVSWADDAARTPVKSELHMGASLGAIAINEAGVPPAPFQVDLAATGITDKLEFKGDLSFAPDSITINAGAGGGPVSSPILSAYLPAGTEARFKEGKFAAAFKASLNRATPGGIATRLEVANVDWADGTASLFHLGQFTLDVARIDLATLDTQVRAIEASGIAGSVGRNSDGTFDAFGIALGVPQAKPAQPVAAPPPAAAGVTDVRAIIAESRAATPLISLDRLDIRIDRFTVTDRARPDAAPVSITGAHAYSKAPFRILGPKPEENPPAALAFETAIDPVTSRVGVELQTAPFAQQPNLSVKLDISGIDGDGVAKVIPELKDFIGVKDLTGANIATSLDAEATVRRRGPTQIDLSRGLDLSFTVNDTRFTRADGAILGGIQKVRGEGFKIESSGGVVAKSLEISGLSGLAWRDEQGLHALGALIKLPEDKPEGAPAADGSSHPSTPATSLAASPSTTPSSPELRIDRLTVSGLDFRFEDRVVQPNVTIPINSLDADIRGLSSRILSQDSPIKFNISAGAGKVKLPKVVRGGVLTGALSDLSNLGKSESERPVELEDREFFSQCIASGNLSLYPSPHGRASISLSGLELPAIRGLAAAAGASVAGGTFDARADARTADNGDLDIRSRLVLTDLQYKEPPNGPVLRYLHLPMPVDTAIAAVESADGSITLPLNFPVSGKGISTGSIVAAAAGAITDVLVKAVAGAPVKIISGFAGLFGDTKGDTAWVEEAPIYLSYTPGVSILDPASQAKLEEVLDRAGSDKKVQVAISHELGSADAELCATRTNPTSTTVHDLAESLRQRRAELLARRISLLPAAQAESIRADEEPRALNELRDVQVQLAGVDDAMDRLYDLLKPGAERTSFRRTRAACLELADWRLNAVRRALATIGGPDGTSRTGIAIPRSEPSQFEQSRLVIQVRHRG